MAARRVLKSRAQRVVRDNFKLKSWADAYEDQWSTYFKLIDKIYEGFRELKQGTDPTDEQVMEALTWGLQEDDTLTDHVAATRATVLKDEEEWDKITLAAAGTLLQKYVNKVEKGEWP